MQEPVKNQDVSGDEKPANSESPANASPADRLTELEAQVKDKENKYLYLYADFENHKKRAIKERSDLIKFGWESVARELLQILDNLELAVAHAPKNVDAKWFEGLQMSIAHYRKTLEKQGVRVIETAGKNFDPNFHEAMGFEKSELPSGQIVRVQAPGYLLHDRLLRPAKVTVSNGQS